MSTYLYGALSRRRLETSPGAALANAQIAAGGDVTKLRDDTKQTVSHWQDSVAALVPAEVLALHGAAMTLGTETRGSGDDATTVITSAGEMTVVFWVLVALAAGLYLIAAKSVKVQDLLRAALASVAFVLWTMLQPSTAFDALGWDPSTLIRTLVALVGAVLVGVAAAALAAKADRTTT